VSLSSLAVNAGLRQGWWVDGAAVCSMEISLTTPALLFPAISLLLLAFTNRFVVLANLIRKLHEQYQTVREPMIFGQIQNLRRRVVLIRNMQAAGVLSMLLCVVSMLVIFAVSLVLLIVSLSISLVEIFMSVGALNLVLKDLEVEARAKEG
jgi:hypothetical protein